MEAFLSSWVTCLGVPKTLTLDRGTQFASASWVSFCGSLRMRHVMMMAYHPQANGLMEQSHRQLKDALQARGLAWTAWLIFPGFSLASGRLPRRSEVSPPRRLLLGSP